jgi:hypothetical protein
VTATDPPPSASAQRDSTNPNPDTQLVSRPKAHDRHAQHMREADARRHAAEQRADVLIRAARARSTSRVSFGNVAGRVAEALNADRCELLILRSADHALLAWQAGILA